MQSLCAKIPLEKGEYFRKKFTDEQLLNKNLMIQRINDFLYIPLLIDSDSLKKLQTTKPWIKSIEIINHNFNKYPARIKNYKELLILPSELIKELPKSYDIIGSICFIKIPLKLKKYSKMIGRAILKSHKNLRTVVFGKGVTGDFRIRDFDFIVGEQNTKTVHKEYGIKLKMDISKVYFSPRLGGEHFRVANSVRQNEVVLDMFTGIGPFSIMISKYSKASEIYSIDINKHAIEYLIKNIDFNKVNNVFPLEGDVEEVIIKVPPVDRIIMNLPMAAQKFIGLAIEKLKSKGVIHFHEMIDEKNLDNRMKLLKSNIVEYGYKLIKMSKFNLGSYSPNINHYSFDLTIKKI